MEYGSTIPFKWRRWQYVCTETGVVGKEGGIIWINPDRGEISSVTRINSDFTSFGSRLIKLAP